MSASRQETSPSLRQLGLLTALGSVLATGCYGAAPPRPAPVALPEVSAGSHLRVNSQEVTEYEEVNRESETCPQGHGSGSEACEKTSYTVKEPVIRTKTTATYGDTPISYGQFQLLTDSSYEQKLVTLEDHSEACHEANLPRYVGMGLMLGGVIAYSVGAGQGGDPFAIAGALGILAGAGSYTAGYFAFGGNRCVKANQLYRQINYAQNRETMMVRGSATASEMRAVAEEFNRRSTRAAAAGL